MSANLRGKTLFITGASRGIGLAIALRAARDGANIVIAAKTAEPHPKLPGTIFSAAHEIEQAGGRALPLTVDVREEAQVQDALDKAVSHFGGLDIVVNNASAIFLADSQKTEMKRFDLMHQVNARGSFLVSKLAVPYLTQAENPHILMLAPPLDLKEKWFAAHTAYSMAKYGMSLVTLGLTRDLARDGIAVNSLWPETAIATAAVGNLLGGEEIIKRSRKPDIVADAAHAILTRPARETTGQFFIDALALKDDGVTDLRPYAVDPSVEAVLDFFLDSPVSANVRKAAFHPG